MLEIDPSPLDSVKGSKVSFIADKQAGQIWTLVTSNVWMLSIKPQRCPSSPSSPPHFAVRSNTLLLRSQQCCPDAIEQKQSSSLRAGSELTAKEGHYYFGWVWWEKHFPLLKQIWSWIQINLRLINSTMISYVNSYTVSQPWIHYIIKIFIALIDEMKWIRTWI